MLRKLRSYRPSHATVVAWLALFVALGGTAYAAATIGSAQIVDNSIKSVDVRNDSSLGGGLTGADIKESTLSGVASANVAKNVLSAYVDSDGTLSWGRGSTVASRTTTGRYIVTFNRDIQRCVPTGSTRLAGELSVTQTPTSKNAWDVSTRDSAGNPTDLVFSLVVVC